MRLKMSCADTAHARGSALVATLLVALLSGCATAPPPAADGWRQQTLPGKPSTHYRWTHKEGRTALQADSQQSASLWRKRLNPAQDVPQQVRFSWWVQDLIPHASVAQPDSRATKRVVNRAEPMAWAGSAGGVFTCMVVPQQGHWARD
ncbi:MAG: DUF3047 domain-containing protein [Betaproteobacteria bacterium]